MKTKNQYKVIVNGNEVLTIPDFKRKHIVINDIPPRFQWNNNSGYCGETAIISAGLYYGQYLSQYDVRLIASNKNQLGANQLLLGINDVVAAKSLRLNYKTKTLKNSKSFMKWVKQQVALGYPVIIGVLNNEYRLAENTKNKLAGDAVYDHIVPVIGFGSDNPLTKNFNNTDKILISDNGLYYLGNSAVPPKKGVRYYFEYEMKNFFSDRKEANNPDGNMYSLLQLPKYEAPGKKSNYAIALLGVMGQEETLPVRIHTNLNYEAPAIKHKSNKRPRPMSLTLTITVSDLKPNTKYNLYYYKDEKDVPIKNFNQKSIKGSLFRTITIKSGTSYTTTLKIKSDQKVFMRAVLAEK